MAKRISTADADKAILKYLKKVWPEGATGSEIIDGAGVHNATVYRGVVRLAKSGQVKKTKKSNGVGTLYFYNDPSAARVDAAAQARVNGTPANGTSLRDLLDEFVELNKRLAEVRVEIERFG